MQKAFFGLGAVVATGVALWLTVFNSPPAADFTPTPQPEVQQPESYECDADAKICPDGSAVGRTGPDCEFAACPSPEAQEAMLTTYLGGSPTALNVTVNPKQVVSDSRCVEGVQCIWAGTVEVRTILSTSVAHGEHVMTLGQPQAFGDYIVTLTEVTPYPKAEQTIPESSYRFTYTIEKR